VKALASLPVVFLLFGIATTSGDVQLPSLFSEHMVLMKAQTAPVWGKADPGEQVTVTLNGKTAQTTADAKGNLADSATAPFDMTVAGKNKILIPDVVVGQVWLASGQSNMALTLKETHGADAEIAHSANPLLRQFQVKNVAKDVPADDCVGTWMVASPQTTPEFTAIGYYFEKRLPQLRAAGWRTARCL